ncbi:hypothetical protein ACEPPU_24375 [Priestia aryabhattai]
MSDKLQQALEGYAWLSQSNTTVLCYLEAVENGTCHESIMKVVPVNE